MRSGLGVALCRMLSWLLAEGEQESAAILLEACTAYCHMAGSESLVVGLASPQGLLPALCSWWLERGSAQHTTRRGNAASNFQRLANASSGLLSACCAALDAAAGTQLASAHASLLEPSAGSKRLKAASPAFWKSVRSSLLPGEHELHRSRPLPVVAKCLLPLLTQSVSDPCMGHDAYGHVYQVCLQPQEQHDLTTSRHCLAHLKALSFTHACILTASTQMKCTFPQPHQRTSTTHPPFLQTWSASARRPP